MITARHGPTGSDLTASLPDLAGGSRPGFGRRPNYSLPAYECGSGRLRGKPFALLPRCGGDKVPQDVARSAIRIFRSDGAKIHRWFVWRLMKSFPASSILPQIHRPLSPAVLIPVGHCHHQYTSFSDEAKYVRYHEKGVTRRHPPLCL